MIILIGSEKGGTGKTTIATNLSAMRAAEGLDVLLLDTDLQGSATRWCQVRNDTKIEPSIFCTQKFGRVDNEVVQLSKKFHDIIIDSGGRDSEELRSSMLVAERFYIPIAPGFLDLWSLEPLMTVVQKASALNPNLKTFIIINRASTNPSVAEIEDTREFIKNMHGFSLAGSLIRERITYRKAVREGLSVIEMKPKDSKAIDEITQLYEEIYHG